VQKSHKPEQAIAAGLSKVREAEIELPFNLFRISNHFDLCQESTKKEPIKLVLFSVKP
jgi:hypothetical protein